MPTVWRSPKVFFVGDGLTSGNPPQEKGVLSLDEAGSEVLAGWDASGDAASLEC